MIRVFLACVGAVVLAMSPLSAAAAPPPLSAYGALPAIEHIAVSESGEKIAYIAVAGEQRRLVMQDLSGIPLGVIAIGAVKVRDILWAGDEHLIVVSTATSSLPEFGVDKSEWWFAQSFSLKKKRFINLAARSDWTFIYAHPELRKIEGKWYAFIVSSDRSSPLLELRRVALDHGGTEIVETMPIFDAQGWVIDAAGVAQARSRYTKVRGLWSLGVRRGTNWPELYKVEAPLDPPNMLGFGRDGRSILVQEGAEAGANYIEISADGKVTPVPSSGRPYRGMIFDPASQRLIGATYFEGDVGYAFFDPADQAAWAAVERAFKGQRVRLSNWSGDRKKVVVEVEGAKSSGVFYLVDLAAKRADIIGEAYPGVPAEQVAEMKPYSYKAADGETVPGFITLPPGREAKKLPLIVFPHGGPETHDGLGFDYWAQAIASRGYAVLQPNFRGSTGYGEKWVQAGYGEWGRKMQTDLSDGVQALAAEGVIDPQRVCIVGASYGGYAAMAGVTIQQGIYRCAVAFAGISDLRDMLKAEARDAGKKSLTMRYWRRFMGVTNDNDPALEAISPLRSAAQASAPILLIHGKDDTVVPYRQSSSLADALRKAGKPVELVTLAGEDHWLSRNATRQQMLEATVGFLLKENPPQ